MVEVTRNELGQFEGRYTPEDYIKQIRACRGLVSEVARRMDVTRAAVYSMARRHESVAEALEDAKERLVDLAEAAITRKIQSGDIAAIIFTLKTQGRARGWAEHVQHSVNVNKASVVGIEVNTAPATPALEEENVQDAEFRDAE